MNDAIVYPSNFLSKVIARVDFPSPLLKVGTHLPSDISKIAIQQFPIEEPTRTIARELQISQTTVKTRETEFTEWHFHGKEREKSLTITPAAVFVKYTTYKSFEMLKADFLTVLSSFFHIYEETQVSRLGLRYVNNIALDDGDRFDWAQYLKNELLCIFNVSGDRESISRAFHNLEFNMGDFNLRFQYGMHNPDYPAPIRRRVYILDFDAYNQGLQDFSEIPNNIERFHDSIQGLFESVITDELRGLMNA